MAKSTTTRGGTKKGSTTGTTRTRKAATKATVQQKTAVAESGEVAISEKAAVAAPVVVESQSNEIARMIRAMDSRLAAIEAASMDSVASNKAAGAAQNGGCGEGACCCFDVVMSRARVIREQQGLLEVGDRDLGPLDITNKYMEMQFHVKAEGLSALWPSLNSFVQMNRKSGWVSVGAKVGKFTVQGSRSIPVMSEAREVDTALVEWQSEHGSSETAYLNLRCGCPTVPVILSIPLTGGGSGGGVVEVEVTAVETCCDTC